MRKITFSYLSIKFTKLVLHRKDYFVNFKDIHNNNTTITMMVMMMMLMLTSVSILPRGLGLLSLDFLLYLRLLVDVVEVVHDDRDGK